MDGSRSPCTACESTTHDTNPVPPSMGEQFYGFARLNYGIIHIRTDGERVLTFTHSGKERLNEAYRFAVSPHGEVQLAAKVEKHSTPPK